ncbi:MAG: ATP-dependent helicase HrpB [Lentisphaerae bacterium GWF2_45_14]|nr:MAG: ATP-dependent helicase HrpB [Lentisphaerae bacterium GWF2_45_14]
MNEELPVTKIIPELKTALARCHNVVLSAPPGAGKTTLLPQSLLHEPWLKGRRIIMLEPRRAAARAAASRISALLGEETGKTAGWRVRGESCVSRSTRIEILTEGILTRRIQSDPELADIGLVIFDEFHERSINADLGLALCLDIQENLREDLRLLVMSATIDVEAIRDTIGNCEIVRCEGRSFPVEIKWEGPLPRRQELSGRAASLAISVISERPGGVLIFLPGAFEINAAAELLKGKVPEDVSVIPLYGSLERGIQDEALAPPAPGHRKIVIATNIAETSLTIEGISTVIDSGFARVSRFSPSSGMSSLETVRISKASAEQRRGRAGRLGPGLCIRLWNEHEHRQLPYFNTPEILESDLTPLCLELAAWGAPPEKLRWLNMPGAGAMTVSSELLMELGALDHSGRVTMLGRDIARLPVHPRLGAMLLRSKTDDSVPLACEIAALLEERDIVSFSGSSFDPDFRERIRLLRRYAENKHVSGVLPDVCRRVLVIRGQLLRMLGFSYVPRDIERAGDIASRAYPDRIGKSRGTASLNYLLRNGKGAKFRDISSSFNAPFITALRLDDSDAEAVIRLALPLSEDFIRKDFASAIITSDNVSFDDERQAVSVVRERKLGAIILDAIPIASPSQELLSKAICSGIRRKGLHVLPWAKESISIRERVIFAFRSSSGEWPDWSDNALLASLEDWLAPFFDGIRSLDALKKLDLKAVLSSSLGYEAKRKLDREYPESFETPAGSKIRIDYSGEEPELPVRVQEMFGCNIHPALRGGLLKIRVKLLSPAMRPVQTTSDLPSFWRGSWELVKKEMKGRYPRHFWPDDPANSVPTRKTRPS